MKLREWFRRKNRWMNSLRWQIVFMVTLTSIVIFLLISFVRMGIYAVRISKMDTMTYFSNTVSQLLMDPRLRNMDMNQFLPEHGEAGQHPADKEETIVPTESVDFPRTWFLDDFHIDLHNLPPQNVQIFYIDLQNHIFLIPTDKTPRDNRVDDGSAAATYQKTADEAKRMIDLLASADPDANLTEVTAEDGDTRLALVTHKNLNDEKVGYFFVRITSPDIRELLWIMIRNSIPTILLLVLFVAMIGLFVGYFLSRKWILWFQRMSGVLSKWAQGDFSEKMIQMEKKYSIAEWEDLSATMNQMSEQLEQVVQTRQYLAAAEERNSIARELHDNIKQQLFSINMNLGAAKALSLKNPEMANEKVAISAQLSQDTLLELDSLIKTLRPIEVTDKTFASELKKLTEKWEKSSGMELEVRTENLEQISSGAGADILSVCREALSNVVRHSGAKKARLVLEASEFGTNLLISDDGHGFDTSMEYSGVGLRSMRERVEALNGELKIKSSQEGTLVKVMIPRKLDV